MHHNVATSSPDIHLSQTTCHPITEYKSVCEGGGGGAVVAVAMSGLVAQRILVYPNPYPSALALVKTSTGEIVSVLALPWLCMVRPLLTM